MQRHIKNKNSNDVDVNADADADPGGDQSRSFKKSIIDEINIGSDRNKRRGWVESVIIITCCVCVFSRVWLGIDADYNKNRKSALARYPSVFESFLHVELLFTVLVATVLQFSKQSASTLSTDLLRHSRQLISNSGSGSGSGSGGNVDMGLPIALVILPLLYSSIRHTIPLSIATAKMSTSDTSIMCIERLLFASLISSAVLLMNVVKRRRLVYPALITLLLLFVYSHFFGLQLVVYLLVYLLLQFVGTRSLLVLFSDSFTVGEASIVSQLFGGFIVETFWYLINNGHGLLSSFGNINNSIGNVTDYQVIFNTLFVLILGTLLILICTTPLVETIRQPYHGQALTSKAVISFYIVCLTIILVILMPTLTLLNDGLNIFLWLINYLASSASRILLILYWIALLSLTILYFNPTSSSTATKSQLPNIIIRKYFHLLAIVMFAPGIVMQLEFMSLSFTIALSALVLVELIKYGNVPPLARQLSAYMDTFTDARDSGLITLTHIYLLLGCSIPVLTCFLFDTSSHLHPLSSLSGILTIGVGDSIASLIGTKYGRTKWFGTSKSIEGTVGGIASTFVSGALILLAIQTDSSTFLADLARLLIASFFSGILEASTTQIDNIILPIIFFSLLNC